MDSNIYIINHAKSIRNLTNVIRCLLQKIKLKNSFPHYEFFIYFSNFDCQFELLQKS
jgi:hypothetical protein